MRINAAATLAMIKKTMNRKQIENPDAFVIGREQPRAHRVIAEIILRRNLALGANVNLSGTNHKVVILSEAKSL